jgi:hypothetical protein
MSLADLLPNQHRIMIDNKGGVVFTTKDHNIAAAGNNQLALAAKIARQETIRTGKKVTPFDILSSERRFETY